MTLISLQHGKMLPTQYMERYISTYLTKHSGRSRVHNRVHSIHVLCPLYLTYQTPFSKVHKQTSWVKPQSKNLQHVFSAFPSFFAIDRCKMIVWGNPQLINHDNLVLDSLICIHAGQFPKDRRTCLKTKNTFQLEGHAPL